MVPSSSNFISASMRGAKGGPSCASISLLKGATVGCLCQLFETCWGMLLQVFRLGYLCNGRVHLGFVLGAVVRI